MPTPRVPLADRFWKYVEPEPNSGCWLWTGAFGTFGYGILRRGWPSRRTIGAHRLAYELCRGPIPANLWVRHRCDNPPCVNPNHLELGSNQDNTKDKIDRKRQARGESQGHAKLTTAAVQQLRRQAAQGTTQWALARQFGLAQATVWAIIHRKSWKDVDD